MWCVWVMGGWVGGWIWLVHTHTHVYLLNWYLDACLDDVLQVDVVAARGAQRDELHLLCFFLDFWRVVEMGCMVGRLRLRHASLLESTPFLKAKPTKTLRTHQTHPRPRTASTSLSMTGAERSSFTKAQTQSRPSSRTSPAVSSSSRASKKSSSWLLVCV